MNSKSISERVLFPGLVDYLHERGVRPNQLTAAGVGCSVVVASLVVAADWRPYALSLSGVFIALALLADALDGDLARRHDLESESGAFFDFAGDKLSDILVYGALTYLCSVPLFGFAAIAGDLWLSGISAKYEALSGRYVKIGIGGRGGGHIVLGLAAFATPLLATVIDAGVPDILSGVLLVVALMKYVTVVQRLRRMYLELRQD